MDIGIMFAGISAFIALAGVPTWFLLKQSKTTVTKQQVSVHGNANNLAVAARDVIQQVQLQPSKNDIPLSDRAKAILCLYLGAIMGYVRYWDIILSADDQQYIDELMGHGFLIQRPDASFPPSANWKITIDGRNRARH